MADENKYSIVASMVDEAEQHADDMSADRIRSMEYYRGIMTDTPSEEGRSKIVKRVLRAHIKKALPSIMRVIFGSDEAVEYQPSGPGDEEGAQQSGDYVNRIIMLESNGRAAIYDSIFDAALVRNGILKWWWDEKQCVKISKHSGLTDDEFAVLAADDEVTVTQHSEYQDQLDNGEVITLHDCKIRRSYTDGRVKVAAVPRERFLIHPDAVTLEDSILTGEKTEYRRSDLVAMGYDKEFIDSLSVAGEEDEEESIRRDYLGEADESQRANDLIEYYDLYIRVDMDGDGISELRHMVFAGGLGERNVLLDEECDEVQYCDVAVMRQPHQWEGISFADDLFDIQQVETVLTRQTLDNLYWQNNPQRTVQRGAIENPDRVINPEFGGVIWTKTGHDVRTAIGVDTVPFIAKDSFGMLEYMDKEASDRTGINDASSGMAPDALQNMTAKASAMIEQAGIGQVDMMVREVADSLKPFFRGILRLITRHQDVARTVRLRDKWVTIDPRQWNADMDCIVNTGLGAGTRERDMMMMQHVLGLQKELLTAFGAKNNPYVSPDNLWNSVSKIVEASGLRTPTMYFSEPDPQRMQQLMNQPEPPSPEQIKAQVEQMKAQAKVQETQAKLQADIELRKVEMEKDRAKEKAQMDADLAVTQAQIAADTEKQRNELASKAALEEQKLQWEREKFYADLQFRQQAEEKRRQDAMQQRQADNFSRSVEQMNG